MNAKLLIERMKSASRGRDATSILPSLVLEIESGFMVAARIDRSRRQVQRMRARGFEANSFEPLLTRSNMANEEELRRVIREAMQALGNGSGRLGLLLPDPVVRVAVLSFETLPDDPQEADALVRWRMKDVLPFSPEEARFAYQVLKRGSEGIELLVMAARSSVLSAYQTAVEQVNGGPALTLPATAALLPLLPEGDGAGQLLVHVCSGWITTVVVVGSHLRAWRNQDVSRLAPHDLVRDVVSEAARVVASCRDHLKVDIGRVWLCARPPSAPELMTELARSLPGEVEPLALDAELGAILPAEERVYFEHFGAPVAGLLINSGKER